MSKKFVSALIIGASLAAVPSLGLAQSASPAQIEELRSNAREAVKNQNPQEALRLVEQLIIAAPTDLRARFFRASILASLDRGDEIVDELKVMLTLNLSAADKRRAEDLIFAIERKGRRLALSSDFNFGFGSTDNANSWPNDGEYSLEDGAIVALPDPVYDDFTSQSDTFYDVSVGLRGSYALAQNGQVKAVFGAGLSEKEGSDTVNMDSSLTKMNVGLESPLPGDIDFQLNYATSSNDRVNETMKADGSETTEVNSDQDKTTLSYGASKKFGNLQLGVRLSSTETDSSATSTADQYDTTNDTTSFSIGSPIGARNYVRLAMNSSEQRSDATGDQRVDSQKKTDKDSDGYSLLYVRVFSPQQRLILSYTSSESTFVTNTIDDAKRVDELTYLSAKYSVNGEALTPYLDKYKVNLELTSLESTSNQEAANLESTSYKLSLSRAFDLF